MNQHPSQPSSSYQAPKSPASNIKTHPTAKPRTLDLEKRLAEGPVITVPTITLEGDANGAPHPDGGSYAKKFSGKYAHRIIKGGVGHSLPNDILST